MWSDESEEKIVYNDCKICIDVSGVYFYTLKSTLYKCPYFQNMHLKENEIIFLDREPSIFPYILNYLRNNESTIICEDKYLLNQLKIEAKFFQLMHLHKNLEKTPVYSFADLISEIRQIKHCLQNSARPITRRNQDIQSNTT